jgi:ATP-dependent Clp protease ATP-binding subunit ClpA
MLFERYTDAARRAVYFSRLEAVHRQQPTITTSDLLVGLTWEDGTRADKVANLRERAIAIRRELGIPHLPTTSLPYTSEKQIPLNDSCKKAIAKASEEADADGEFWIDCDHILRSLMAFPNGANAALTAVGLSLAEVRLLSGASRAVFPSQPKPYWRIFRTRAREYWPFALIIAAAVLCLLYLRSQN